MFKLNKNMSEEKNEITKQEKELFYSMVEENNRLKEELRKTKTNLTKLSKAVELLISKRLNRKNARREEVKATRDVKYIIRHL